MQNAEPQKEHKWLQQLVGEWTYESECVMGPDQPLMKSAGTATVRPIGGLWIADENTATMPDGSPGTMIFTLGYDPAKKRFVGTFIATMMAMLWIYDGELDAAEKVLTLNADGPSFTDPNKTAHYKDCFEIVSPDHHILSSQFQAEDGTWHRFMTSHYKRKK